MNRYQLISAIIEPTLILMGDKFDSRAAQKLLLYTCAVESDLGHYVRQYPSGPARGIYQMERRTYFDLFDNFLSYKPDILKNLLRVAAYDIEPDADALMWDMRLATVMARLQYYRWPAAMPDEDDEEGLINYYLKYWGPNPKHATLESVRKKIALTLGD